MGPRVQLRKADVITLEVLQDHFHLPMVLVAQKHDVGLTYFKRICRAHGILRWPYRKFKAGMWRGTEIIQHKPKSEAAAKVPATQVPGAILRNNMGCGVLGRDRALGSFRSVDFSGHKLSEMTPLDATQIPSCSRDRIEDREDLSSTILCSQGTDPNSHNQDGKFKLVPSSDISRKQPSAFSRPMARNTSPAAAQSDHSKLPGSLPPSTDMNNASFLLSTQLPMPETLQGELNWDEAVVQEWNHVTWKLYVKLHQLQSLSDKLSASAFTALAAQSISA